MLLQPETLRHSLESGKAPVYEDNYKPASTITAMEEFVRSSVWKDLKDFLISWREQARSRLEAAVNSEEIYRLQGEATSYSKLLVLPEAILEQMRQNEEQTHGNERREFTRTTV